jgi:hypothetical protein
MTLTELFRIRVPYLFTRKNTIFLLNYSTTQLLNYSTTDIAPSPDAVVLGISRQYPAPYTVLM